MREPEGNGVAETIAIAGDHGTTLGVGAALLRLHRHRHLWRRRTERGAYICALSTKGEGWLAWRRENRQ